MVYSHLNLVQETAILVEASEFAVYRYVFVEIASSYRSMLPSSRSYLLVSEGSELGSDVY